MHGQAHLIIMDGPGQRLGKLFNPSFLESPDVEEIVESHSVTANYVALKGVGQKVEIKRINFD